MDENERNSFYWKFSDNFSGAVQAMLWFLSIYSIDILHKDSL